MIVERGRPMAGGNLRYPEMRNRQRHILIVDDSEDDRAVFGEYLTRQGHRISKACDGREGLAKAFELHPHLILMDLWLPITSGWDVIKRLRIDTRTKHIPILVITGHTGVRPLDCDGMILKPCQLNELGAEIMRILATHAQLDDVLSPPEPSRRPEHRQEVAPVTNPSNASQGVGLAYAVDDLWGPFPLTPGGIGAAITAALPGVYALGKLETGSGVFKVRYVGRDDQDVKIRLTNHLAEWYPHFFYRCYFSAQQAFEEECELYHKFHPSDNKAHPSRDQNSDWACPRCGIS